MSDLRDGESVEIKGSGAKPYVVRNTAGAYSCTCPAWRNQSVPSDRRTCKHIRRLRGDAAEEARLGGALPARSPGQASSAPAVLLASVWTESIDPSGWWMSEKLDGVRALWDGTSLVTRRGNSIRAPRSFLGALPKIALDGELWVERGAFQRTVGIVRGPDDSARWRDVRFVAFDAPEVAGPFEQRLRAVQDSAAGTGGPLVAHAHVPCDGVDHLRRELASVEALGGEGLMLRAPASAYEAGRSMTLLKVKSSQDDEACVVDSEPGEGRFAGMMGSLRVRRADGCEFSIGTGFSDAERREPPPVGAIVNFRHQGLTDDGVPRFPAFVRVVDAEAC